MSAFLVESPLSSSQLYFNWIEDLQGPEAAQLVSAEARPGEASSELPNPASRRPSAADSNPSSAEVEPQSGSELDEYRNQSFSEGHLDIVYDQESPRICKPVRMGGVMIKLLKRYGITDQEIAEGLANYAARGNRQVAS